VTRQSTAVRRVIGYVPQALSADGSLTGYENLLIFAKLYDIPANRRDRHIRDTALPSVMRYTRLKYKYF